MDRVPTPLPRGYLVAVVAAVVGVVAPIRPDPTHAVVGCKARANRATGVIEVNGRKVAAHPRWGTAAGQESSPFFNQATCFTVDKMKGCTIAAPATFAATVPPATCEIFVADDGPESCAAIVRGCTPGLRIFSSVVGAFLPVLSLEDGGTTVRFSGVNLQLVDGTGTTGGPPNGRGNLIVGYNEDAGSTPRSGSHNLVVGPDHGFTSYGGLIVGWRHGAYGAHASVSAGTFHHVYGTDASVTGGAAHTIYAGADTASISGGFDHTVSAGRGNSITGGRYNQAYYGTEYTTLSGGRVNQTEGDFTSVTGGLYNVADGYAASVSGGAFNRTRGRYSSISGGLDSEADQGASISGGSGHFALGDTSSVSGGRENSTSPLYAYNASVSGGRQNEAYGSQSHVSGGRNNVATGEYASISGGRFNTAGSEDPFEGRNASVSGGRNNEASGDDASVSGGNGIVAAGPDEWHAGASPGHPTFGPPFGPGVY